MGVYIKGMEMPTRCGRCDMRISDYDDGAFDHYECCITAAIIDNLGEKMVDCPLVNVPPHYDLIDHNALKIAVMNGDCETRVDFLKHTMDCINKAPVVIPSDMPTYNAREGFMKNGGAIRAMSDEELAKWLVERVTESPWCKPDAPIDPVTKQCQIWDCEKCALEWLRKEANADAEPN